MKMGEIKEIAKKRGISFKIGFSKQYLIREIQIREGYTPCFQTRSACEQKDCLWFGDCIRAEKGGKAL
ncbi:MAG TPA: hypothetical protein VJZ49_00605 [Syntrophales bacterium]|nr:hypothetical protein [Syntrophales bacterium]